MIEYVKPVAHDLFVVCIDDTKPSFPVKNWVEKGKVYRLKFMTAEPALNQSEDRSFVIADLKGNEINPTDDIRGLRESRFTEYMTINLN